MTCSRIVLVTTSRAIHSPANHAATARPATTISATIHGHARRRRFGAGSAYVYGGRGCVGWVSPVVIASYIRSGASTPRRSSPLRSTWPVASLSHSLVRCTSPIGSSPSGITRQLSYHRW